MKPIAWILAVASLPAAAAAVPEKSPRPAPVLLGIEERVEGNSYVLRFRGPFHHRLVRAGDGLSVTVELPEVVSAVPRDALPGPRGIVRRIAVEASDPRTTRVRFDLDRPADPVAETGEEALGLKLMAPPGRPGNGTLRERPLGVEDLLEVKVFEVPELNRTLRVSERGTISLPLVGEIRVEGLTPRELEESLHRRLEERYLKDPQVSVFVEEHGSKKVSILGAVRKPGVYEMLGPRNLLQMVSEAGGLSPEVGAELYVIRTGEGGASSRIAVDIDDLLVNRTPGINLDIEPGDVISVPVDRPVYVFVDGAVKRPGRLEEKESRPISLLQAIAKAGGATDRAQIKNIQILRADEDGTQKVIRANLKRIRKGKAPDILLENGDVVVVPETFF